MTILLDTHALLWWLADDDRLGPRARALIEDPANDILVSIASLWEIVVETRVGKLEADIGEVAAAVGQDGFALRDIGVAHLQVLAALPAHHRDPFDHLLIALALAEDATLVTDDRHAPAYPARFVPCFDPTSRPGQER